MITAFYFSIVFAAIMFFVAVVNWVNSRRKLSEFFEMKTILEQAEKEKKLLKEEIIRSSVTTGNRKATEQQAFHAKSNRILLQR